MKINWQFCFWKVNVWSFLFQNYEDFDLANEDDELEEFLGIPRKTPKSVPAGSSKEVEDRDKKDKPAENGTDSPAAPPAEPAQNG